jgi:hypothetical protein
MQDITRDLKVINSLVDISEYLRDKSLELKESEELFNAIKSFEDLHRCLLNYIKKQAN